MGGEHREDGPHPIGGVEYPRTLQDFDFGGSGNGARGHAEAAPDLVPGDVVRDEPEVRGERAGPAARDAWTWLHKMRRAMVRPGRDRLHGAVEVDETYVGGVEEGVHGRETRDKSIVAIALEILAPKGFGRVRMRRVPDVSGRSLVGFVRDVVEPGSEVHTDGWRGYNDVPKHGYKHRRTIISASGDPAHVAMPGVHRIASLVKRWLLGTHQGSVSAQHLDYYLDEYTFRFNRRTSRARGLLFYRLLQQAVEVDPMPYRRLVGGKPDDGKPDDPNL